MSVDEAVNILLVDDRSEDLIAMKSILSRPDYHLVTAQSGPEALRRLLERDFAVILLDVFMPNMDGFEVAALIKQRERTQHTPIIFLTAAGPDLVQIYRGYSAGAVDYLAKPVDPDVVCAKVSIFADLFRKEQRLQRQAEALRQAERRERELQIAELRLAAERRYRNLAEAIPIMVWTATPEGAVDYCNRRWLEYTGISLERARGSGWLGAVHEEDSAECERIWNGAVEARTICEVECRMRRAFDGAFRWHLGRIVPELAEDGSLIGWLGTFTDFEELKQAIRARDEFLSIASHELRTPLTALKLRIQGLQRLKDMDDRQRRNIDGAARQTDRLERLIDNLLDVSRITTGHLEIEPEEIDLAEVVHDVVERLRDEATAAGSRIDVDAVEAVPGYWDRLRLEQVITNLLSNAVKYGSGKPINVMLSASDDAARLAVRDGGIGIASEDAARIFDQFERAASRRRYGGLGMGLYITRQIVTAHNGTIHVESQLNEGSLFTVELPRLKLRPSSHPTPIAS